MTKFVQNLISNLQPIWVDMLFYVFTDHFSHVFYFQILADREVFNDSYPVGSGITLPVM